VDRKPPEVESILENAQVPYIFTNGIGNWTSKNVLLKMFHNDGSDFLLLLEDDVEFMQEGAITYLSEAYQAAQKPLGFYKLSSDVHHLTFQRDFIGEEAINSLFFQKVLTYNTSAVLLIDRKTIDRIGYFYNSYYENGFYDYRDRMRQAGICTHLLVPKNLHLYLRVDDTVPSTVSRAHRKLYRQQIVPPALNAYRPYRDWPAYVVSNNQD